MKTLLLISVICLPAFAGYSYQSTVTLGNSSQVTATQTNFPVLFCANMTLGNGNACQPIPQLKGTGSGGAVTSTTYAYDVTFSSTACASPTYLEWEMVSGVYNSTSGAMEAWVNLSTLSANGTSGDGATPYLCIGNSAITSLQSAGNPWGGYGLVLHFPNGTSSLSLADSTPNNLTVTPHGAPSPSYAIGQIDGGVGLYSASTQYLTVASGLGVTTSTGYTVSGWINPVDKNYYRPVFASDADSYDGDVLEFGGGNGCFWAGGNVGCGADVGTWQSFAEVVSSATSGALYKNGASLSTTTGTNLANATKWYFGWAVNCCQVGNAIQDEIRVYAGARSATWIKTEYNNQAAPASFLTINSPVALSICTLSLLGIGVC